MKNIYWIIGFILLGTLITGFFLFQTNITFRNLFGGTLPGITAFAFPDTGIISVENFGFVIPTTIGTVYAPFTKGQNFSNSVPFVTKSVHGSGSTEDWRHHLTEATFNSTGVLLERGTIGGVLTFNVSVVEFDSSSVKVQSGSFTIADGDLATTSSISDSVNISRSALIFYSKIVGGGIDDDYESAAVKGAFANSTALNLLRQDTTGDITGTWYVFESLDGAFTVQSKLLTLPNGAETATVGIDSIQMNKTFLIVSYSATENSDNARDGSTSVVLTSSTLITATRGGSVAGDSIFLNIFVITFTGDENVQRGTLGFTDAASEPETVTATINSVNLSNSMAWNPVLSGRMSSDGTGEGDLQGAFSRLDFANSTAIRGFRGRTGGETIASYEVVEWVIGEAVDNPPKWFDNSTNSTLAGELINHSVFWTDDTALDGFIFSFDNGTGGFTNDTFVSFPASGYSNVLKKVNQTVGSTIRWIVYANDSEDQWNNTVTFTYDTTSAPVDSCSPSTPLSADYVFECSDDCVITSNVDAGGFNVTINGTGSFTMTDGNITNYNKITIKGTDSSNICRVRCNGGCFKQ